MDQLTMDDIQLIVGRLYIENTMLHKEISKSQTVEVKKKDDNGRKSPSG